MKFEFVCPHCKSRLVRKITEYLCKNCKRSYPVHEGIPCFNMADTYYGEVSRSEMQEAIQIARKRGWKTSVSDWLGPKNPWLVDYISSSSRTTWFELLTLKGTEKILDLGCGWGKISLELASQVAEVVALDGTIERVEFTKIRSDQEGLHNVIPVCNGNTMEFPFMDASFDWVILNGVLEHIGQISPLSIEATQQATLKEIQRVLRPDGHLYMGIENRYGYNYFLGARDHGNLRFTSITPRRIANAASKVFKQKPYDIRTHSYRKYIRMLKQAGFSEAEFYWPIPSYQFPEHIIPLKTKKQVSAYLNQQPVFSPFKTRIISWTKTLGLLERLIPCYSIVSTR